MPLISFRGSRVKPGMTQMVGFSLLELILSIAIFAILGGATAIPFASRFFNSNSLENTTNEAISSLRTAQINALSGKERSPWGVHIEATKIIMFKGSSYIPPGTVFDQEFIVPGILTLTPMDITFHVLTGTPSAAQTITIQNTLGDNHVVQVNEAGTVDVD